MRRWIVLVLEASSANRAAFAPQGQLLACGHLFLCLVAVDIRLGAWAAGVVAGSEQEKVTRFYLFRARKS